MYFWRATTTLERPTCLFCLLSQHFVSRRNAGFPSLKRSRWPEAALIWDPNDQWPDLETQVCTSIEKPKGDWWIGLEEDDEGEDGDGLSAEEMLLQRRRVDVFIGKRGETRSCIMGFQRLAGDRPRTRRRRRRELGPQRGQSRGILLLVVFFVNIYSSFSLLLATLISYYHLKK